MKIMHEHLNFQGNTSFTVKWDDFPHFTYPWHFHSEYELTYVIKSYGKRFVADHIGNFKENDLVLLGCNLPHFWKNDEVFLKNDPKLKVNAVVIQFPSDFFKQQIQSYPEFHPIKELLKRSGRGISFKETVSIRLGEKIKQLLNKEGLERTLSFLDILNQLAQTKEYKILASENYRPELFDWSSNRLNKVMHLINTNYRHSLNLEYVADKIGMNPTAFCRYFKEKTGKSFSELVIEMRIGHACKLLIEGNLNISQICYESGFNNLSNFNRQFKKHTSYSPSQYKNQFHLV